MKAKNVAVILFLISLLLLTVSFTASPVDKAKAKEQEANKIKEKYKDLRGNKILSVETGEGSDLVAAEMARFLDKPENRDFIYDSAGVNGAAIISDTLDTPLTGGGYNGHWLDILRPNRYSLIAGDFNGKGWGEGYARGKSANPIDGIFPINPVQLNKIQYALRNPVINSVSDFKDSMNAETRRKIAAQMDMTSAGMRNYFSDWQVIKPNGAVEHSFAGSEKVAIMYLDWLELLRNVSQVTPEFLAAAKLQAIQNLRNEGFLFNGFDIAPDPAKNATNTGRKIRDKMRNIEEIND